jgi:hypothetical protein
MATKTAHDAAKKKAAKERKLLIVLALLLVLALGYAYKTLTKLHSSGSTPVAVSAGATVPSSTVAAPTASAPSSSSGASDLGAGSGSTASGDLVSAVKPTLDQGQLESFTLLPAKNPFASDGPSSSSSTSTSSSTSKQKASGGGSKTPPAKYTSAVISVNGVESLVTLDGVFPQSSDASVNGIFKLVSLTKSTAKVGIVGGSYASGSATLTLHVGKAVTLANTADGKRYTLELYPQGTTPPPSGQGPASTGSTSTTTTPTTTTTPSTPTS